MEQPYCLSLFFVIYLGLFLEIKKMHITLSD